MPFLTGNLSSTKGKSEMAKKKRYYFIVGLFVTLAFLITAFLIIWINASKYFEQGSMYVTFFDESVQGLTKDSEVKYQGVKVGRVTDIRIAPDNKTVAVYMMINLRGDLSKEVVAQLTMTGITGLMFVNLVPRQPGQQVSAPVTFATEYPVIPSMPSEISQILSGVKEVVDSVKNADLGATIKEIREAAAGIKNLTDGKQVKDLMAKADSAVGYLRDALKKVDKAIAGGKLNGILAETHSAVKGASTLMHNLNTSVSASKIPDTLKSVRLTLSDARGLLDKLKRTTATLDLFIERLYMRPPDLFFGKPPKGRSNEKPSKAQKAGR
jgi:phospholipid/cholesterol/gamma-HCH transport system substrate-binding protein